MWYVFNDMSVRLIPQDVVDRLFDPNYSSSSSSASSSSSSSSSSCSSSGSSSSSSVSAVAAPPPTMSKGSSVAPSPPPPTPSASSSSCSSSLSSSSSSSSSRPVRRWAPVRPIIPDYILNASSSSSSSSSSCLVDSIGPSAQPPTRPRRNSDPSPNHHHLPHQLRHLSLLPPSHPECQVPSLLLLSVLLRSFSALWRKCHSQGRMPTSSSIAESNNRSVAVSRCLSLCACVSVSPSVNAWPVCSCLCLSSVCLPCSISYCFSHVVCLPAPSLFSLDFLSFSSPFSFFQSQSSTPISDASVPADMAEEIRKEDAVWRTQKQEYERTKNFLTLRFRFEDRVFPVVVKQDQTLFQAIKTAWKEIGQ